MKQVTLGGEAVAIANVGGSYYAFGGACTHDQGPLADGDLEGKVVTCPWHFSQFDVTTGEVLEPPAEEPVRSYAVKVEGNAIYISKPD
jgi:nitrite reductase/ring-hydroxylating ferredoxin subunit